MSDAATAIRTIKQPMILGLPEYGSYFTVIEKTLMTVAMDHATGVPDFDMDGLLSWDEVTAPTSQNMLDRINKLFDTTFCMCQFAGR